MKTRVMAAGIAAVLLGACSSDDSVAGSTTSSANVTTPPAATSTEPSSFVPDDIPVDPSHAADTGCLDHPGTFRGYATDWYPAAGGSSLVLNGARSTSQAMRAFATATNDLASELVPSFVLDSEAEFLGRSDCVTHRYVVFTRREETLVVAAWRLDAVADALWVPNEAPFRSLDDTTLVSEGKHITAVLVVGPDGTTGRASGYGTGAGDLVAGWPSTFVPNPDAPPAGATPVSTEVLVELARGALQAALDARTGS